MQPMENCDENEIFDAELVLPESDETVIKRFDALDVITRAEILRDYALKRAKGWTWAEIAASAKTTPTNARTMYERALTFHGTGVGIEAARTEQLELLRWGINKCIDIIETKHYAISQGRVVSRIIERDPFGDNHTWEDVIDDAPTLAALATLERLSKRMAALGGYDSVVRVDVAAHVSYDIPGVDLKALQ
jgi:hypothetical protein